ncbi:hypothetical protein RUM43_000360, partial [Polyplax serrata]
IKMHPEDSQRVIWRPRQTLPLQVSNLDKILRSGGLTSKPRLFPEDKKKASKTVVDEGFVKRLVKIPLRRAVLSDI